MIGLIVALALMFAFFVWVMAMYNGLVRLRNQVKNAWAQIDVQLKRRHDLIPNLVETVKGYMTHERATLENVTQARIIATQAKTPGEAGRAEGQLNQALGQLYVVMENYPDLKANQNFLSLQEELTSTENKIGFSRQFYNDSVMHYNNQIQMFPSNMVAGMFNFQPSESFEIEVAEERNAPKVSF